MPSRFETVLSRGTPDGDQHSRDLKGVRVFDWLNNQDDYIHACDVIVSRAGHGTIMKALTYGKPMVLIPIPDHTEQIGNATRAAQLHVAKVIDQNALNANSLTEAIDELTNTRSFRKNSQEISHSVRALNAVSSACDIVEKLAAAN
jgi:UDP:flavonoid glycosyltransferase YjiC (YdhE family)